MSEFFAWLFGVWFVGGVFRFLYLLEDQHQPPSLSAVGAVIWPITGGIFLIKQAIAQIKDSIKSNG